MIRVQNLRKRLDARLALKGLSFQASDGTITGVPRQNVARASASPFCAAMPTQVQRSRVVLFNIETMLIDLAEIVLCRRVSWAA
jgi:hypothetical protein